MSTAKAKEIPYLSPDLCTPQVLHEVIYSDLEHDYYWSDCWSPDFYRTLARAGFISVAQTVHPDIPIVLPEIQVNYAVLDWSNLHKSKKMRSLLRRGILDRSGICLVLQKNIDNVAEGIAKCYGADCWLIPSYRELLRSFEAVSDDFCPISVELRSRDRGQLLGGELGYCVGSTYTSLSGLLDRTMPGSNSMGTVQLLTLARLLEECGYAFWNLGHPYMEYKSNLGAKTITRQEFLSRWLVARDRRPNRSLLQMFGIQHSCQELLLH